MPDRSKLIAALLPVLLATTPLLAEEVRLSNGDVLTGEIVESTDEAVTLDHAVLGRVTLGRDQIDAIGNDLSVKPKPKTPKLPPPEEAHVTRKKGLLGTPFLRGYDKRFLLGVNGSNGNSDTFSFYSRFAAESESEALRTDLTLRYFLNKEDGERTRNDFEAFANRDWKIPDSAWFYFGRAFYKYDDFQPWLHRVGTFGGPGYQFVDEDDLQVLGRVGAGAIWEDGEVDEWTPEALIGLEIDWDITDGQRLELRNTLYPSLDDFPENRNVTTLLYTIDMDNVEDGLILQFGIENEYESTTVGDAEHNDLKYLASVGLEF